MSNELTTQDQTGNPFGRLSGALAQANAGSIEIESQRAIAEAQGQLVLAKKFPRNVAAAISEFMDSCSNPAFAATAFYAVPNRGSGPSIRFAEEAARCFGNFDFGHKEIGRNHDSSDVEVYAWDKEKNNFSRRQINIKHVLDTRNGPKRLTDQADIDNKIANVASKQMRGRIMALLPKHMVAMGIEKAKATIAGNSELPISQRILKMAEAFKKYGVSVEHLESHLGHKLDQTTLDEFVDLTGIFNALRDGAKAAEYFDLTGATTEAGTQLNAAVAATTATPAAKSPATTRVARTPAQPKSTPAAAPAAQEHAEEPATAPAESPAAPKPQQQEQQPDDRPGPPDDDTPLF